MNNYFKRLNALIKRNTVAECIKYHVPTISHLEKTQLQSRDTENESERIEKDTPCLPPKKEKRKERKRAGVGKPISDEIDFRAKEGKRDKEVHYI